MSQTERVAANGDAPPPSQEPASARLAGNLFDEVIAPLAGEHRSRGEAPPFPLWRDPDAPTYFVPSTVSRMTSFDFPGGGTADGLVDALGAYWSAEGEVGLAASVPHLREIVESLRDEFRPDDGSVDIFCYTFF
jgi:hypothetical protein